MNKQDDNTGKAAAPFSGSDVGALSVRPANGQGARFIEEPRRASRATQLTRAFRHRNYQLFFFGQLISLCGTWMQNMAQQWLVYRLTGSPVMLGLVGFCGQIPIFLLSPFTGTIADRFNRRSLLVGTQTASMLLAFALAALVFTRTVQPWHLPVLAALLGVVNALDVPTRQSFVVEMVGKEDLLNAIALNSSMFNSARILGPMFAGILVAVIGEGWCFFLNGASYLAVIAGLLLMVLTPRPYRRPSESTLSRMAEGFTYVWHERTIRLVLLQLGVVSLVGVPYVVLMPIFADKILHGGPKAMGLLMGSVGAGALLGGLILAARRGVRGLERWIVLCTAGFGVSLILFATSRTFWLSVGLLMPVGFCMTGQMAASNTLIQTIVPDHLRGRVMSVYSMMFIGMAPFGSLLAGFVAHRFGAPVTVIAGGCACLVAVALLGTRLVASIHGASDMVVAGEMAAGDPPEEETGRESCQVPQPKRAAMALDPERAGGVAFDSETDDPQGKRGTAPMKPGLLKALKIGVPTLVVLAVAIQFVPVARDNPPVTGDFSGPAPVKALLKRACYDCHSNETVWPAYSHVAPISWLVASDVHEGRSNVNFSEWGDKPPEGQTFIRENVGRMVEKGAMPPWDYSLMHSESKLTDAEKATLTAWANAPEQPAASAEKASAAGQEEPVAPADFEKPVPTAPDAK